jgi:tetratricopeptide (TPR) repeat protein
LLKNAPFMPLRDLLAIDYTSREYNEGSAVGPFVDRRGVFYAESWALMHYLQLGNPARASQLARYLVRLHDGEDPGETFTAVFGDPAALERELREYLRKFSLPVIRVDFAGKGRASGGGPADTLNEIDATIYLSDLLGRTGHVDEARRRLQKVVEANPSASAAAETLGVLELNAGNPDRALPWLERAAQDRSNAGAQVLWGRAVIDRYENASADGRDTGMPKMNDARVALAQAVELRPDDAETLATLGRAESIAGEDTAKALALLDRAVALAPAQDEYRLMLAEELVRQREFARAMELLAPLAAAARRAEIRDAATRVISNATARASERARAIADAVPEPEAPAGIDRPRPSFRVPRPDETRAAGMLIAVECGTAAIVLRIVTDDESLRLSAASAAAVQFISYAATSQASIACGPVNPPTHVFATYVESDAATQATGIDGRAIAIEVLPEGYEVTPP